jgi:hypothetical protein
MPMGSSLRLGLMAAAAAALLGEPAFAQFGGANPPRPPGAVPNARMPAPPPAAAPGAPPLNMQDAMPPEEMEEDAATAPPPPPPMRGGAPQTATRGVPPPVMPGPPGSINSQPLPPPPGTVANAPGSGSSVPPLGAPGTGGAGQMKPPQPADPSVQPGDEIVTEMPAVKIPNPTAVFAGLDKITGRITTFDVGVNETVQFGALQVKPRVCYTRPATESTATDGFVEVAEVTLQGDVKRIFSGWMFAASPGLHAVEHPIYDVWLTGCKGGSTVVGDTSAPGPTQATGSSGTGKSGQQQRTATPPGTPPSGATAAAPTAPARQAPARQQTAPQAQPAPDSMQPLPPPPGSTPVQWPPRR